MIKTILITGSTDGIGKYLAMKLASEGHKVIIHGRNAQKLRVTLNEIKLKTGNKDVFGYLSDFSKIQEVYNFTQKIKTDFNKIDILVNNAGAYFGSQRVSTAENIEMTFMLSVQVPYIITTELQSLLENSKEGRVIHTSSYMHHFAQLRKRDFSLVKNYSSRIAYSNAKLYTIWLAKAQAEILKRSHSSLTVNAYHPGLIKTNLGNDNIKRNLKSRLLTGVMKPFSKNLEQGIETVYYLIESPEIRGVSGEYFSEKKISRVSLKGYNSSKGRELIDYCKSNHSIIH